jgi:hypothetical protein
MAEKNSLLTAPGQKSTDGTLESADGTLSLVWDACLCPSGRRTAAIRGSRLLDSLACGNRVYGLPCLFRGSSWRVR